MPSDAVPGPEVTYETVFEQAIGMAPIIDRLCD